MCPAEIYGCYRCAVNIFLDEHNHDLDHITASNENGIKSFIMCFDRALILSAIPFDEG